MIREEIERCSMCDPDGYKPNRIVCDHVDRTEVAKRGTSKVYAALKIHPTERPTNAVYEDLVDRQRRLGPPQQLPHDGALEDAEPTL